jgi:hypothetical protein
MLDLTEFIFAVEVPPDKIFELLTTRWGVGRNLAATLIDCYGGHVYDIFLKLKELNSMGDSFVAGIQMHANNVQMCLDFDGDKLRMRELLTQIAVNGFAPIKKLTDREAEIISKNNVGGLVQKDRAMVIGFPAEVWGKYVMGLIPSKQSIRLVIAKVLEDNPVLADGPRAVKTGVVDDLKSPSPPDKEISKVEIKIEEVEAEIKAVVAEIKASTDPEEKKQLRKKEEKLREEKWQLRKEKEQLREERLIFLRRQDGSDK